MMACSSQNQTNHGDNKVLQEAAEVHTEALKIEKEIQSKLEALQQRKNTINIQGRALTEAEIAFVNQVEALEASLRYWEENHVEVPGFEHNHDEEGHSHDHDHGHNHDHNHEAKLEVAPTDMLIIQKEFRDSMLAMQKRVLALRLP